MIRISADSTVDLSNELLEKYGITIFALHINLGEDEYNDDGKSICPDDLYAYAERTGELAKTAAGGLVEYEEFFEKLTQNGDTVIHFNISSGLSSSHNNARMAAEDMENVYVIDSLNLSTGIGLLVIRAAELAAQGKSAEEIVADITERIPCVDVSFVIDTLEYLHKGGRCSALAKFGANLLSLKPCIEVREGTMGAHKKYKGKISGIIPNYIRDRIVDHDDIITDRVFVTHTKMDDEIVSKAVEQVKEMGIFGEVLETMAGCTISTHCGPNTLGVLFLR
ncbi:MAG: DegV family protein, partial [Clostridia bacterium]|nr:DegV family protein [Clostridia bacterium]